MGGNTSSCTPRGAEADSAAVSDSRAAPSMGVVDGGADSYFFLQSAVVCVVDKGWFVHEPAGNLGAAGEPLLVELALEAGLLALAVLTAGAVEAAAFPNCCRLSTAYRMGQLNSAPAANMSIVPACTALHHAR